MRSELLVAACLLTGCSTVCKGPGCVSTYSAERLSVIHWTDDVPSTIDAWEDAQTLYKGADTDGAGWTVIPGPIGKLIIGMPEANRVVRVPFHEGTGGIDPELEITGTGDFGGSLAIVDIDGDTIRDLLVGAPDWSFGAGAVYVFLGAGGGMTGTLTADDADWVFEGTSPADHFGTNIHVCADLTGDGRPEIAITAPWLEDPDDHEAIPNLAGGVFLYDSAELVGLEGPQSPWGLGVLYLGDAEGDGLGAAVLCRADFTGDRQADIAIGAPYNEHGKVYLIEVDGTPGAEHYPGSGSILEARPVVLEPGVEQAWFGSALAFGEFDRQTPLDLVVGAPGAFTGSGRVEIFRGADLFAREAPEAWRVVSNPDREEEFDHFGRFVGAVDLEGDLVDDLLVGAPDWYGDNNLYDTGSLFLWPGSWVEDQANFSVGSAPWKVVGTAPFQRVGRHVGFAPVNEDGVLGLLLPTRTTPPEDR